MSLLLLTHTLLLGVVLSQSESCGWAIINDELQPLHYCHQTRTAAGSTYSFLIECSANHDAVQIKWWLSSGDCSNDIEPSQITHPMASSFNCNDTLCDSSHVTLRSHYNGECDSSGNVITDTTVIVDGPNFIDEFAERTLLTEHCFNASNSPHHQLISCSNDSYSIHSYSGLVHIRCLL